MREGFVFYRSFAEALADLDDQTFRKVMDAIMWYALDGKEPELAGIPSAIFKLVKPQIDANQRRYENGRKGGRPKKGEGTSEPVKSTPKKAVKTAQKANPAEAWFEEFWKAYPRKVAKPTARAKFLTKCKDEETFNKIMLGLGIAKKGWTDPQYIPHPTTWLNQERWTDDPQVAIRQSNHGRVVVAVPDFIEAQERGEIFSNEEASEEQIAEIKRWQEMMKE